MTRQINWIHILYTRTRTNANDGVGNTVKPYLAHVLYTLSVELLILLTCKSFRHTASLSHVFLRTYFFITDKSINASQPECNNSRFELLGKARESYTLVKKKICKFNVTKSMEFTKLVHQTEINVLCTVNLQIIGESN